MSVCGLNEVRNRLERVQEKILQSCQGAGRNKNDVKLLVVTKRRKAHIVASLTAMGVKDIGENYVQELIDKQVELGDITENFNWHLIGPLQRRKAKYLPGRISMMHSVDRLEVAQKLDMEFSKTGKILHVFLQVNVSGEGSKSGWFLSGGKASNDFLSDIEAIMGLSAINVVGLMTMPPYSPDPETTRKYYVLVRQLADYLNHHLGMDVFHEFSMGTSFDFPIAIQEGSTYVRIGEAILGPRE